MSQWVDFWCIVSGVMRRWECVLISALSLMTLVESPSLFSTRTLFLPVRHGAGGEWSWLNPLYTSFTSPQLYNSVFLYANHNSVTRRMEKWYERFLQILFITALKTSPNMCTSHYWEMSILLIHFQCRGQAFAHVGSLVCLLSLCHFGSQSPQ